jgi:hypothetical protein
MDGRVYVSSGRPNRDEKKMIEDITRAVSKLKETNPAEYMNFRPATNKLELREWYKKYCIEDAEIISETRTQTMSTEKETKVDSTESTASSKDAEKNLTDAFDGANDPFNARETIKRDYVTDQVTDTTDYTHEEEIVIEEPQGLPSDFKLPTEEDNNNTNNGGGNQQGGKQEKIKPEPINPDLKDLDDSQKRRVFKQTARSLVLAYKQFSGLPFKYIATRDINAAKMAEYDITGILDTNVVLELPNDVHLSIAQYFEQQCMKADGLFELDPDVEKEIEDALTDVLMEKQFALTPTQRLMVAVGQDLVNKGIQLFQFRAEVRTTLDYLKSNHAAKEEELRKREETLNIKEQAFKEAVKKEGDINVVPQDSVTTMDVTDAVVEEIK